MHVLIIDFLSLGITLYEFFFFFLEDKSQTLSKEREEQRALLPQVIQK